MNPHIDRWTLPKSVPVLRGLPGIGVAWHLHRNALGFFSETVQRYGDRVELRVLGRRALYGYWLASQEENAAMGLSII